MKNRKHRHAHRWANTVMVAVLAMALMTLAFTPMGMAQDRPVPLRLEGKKTLYQRALTRLGAEIRESPEAQSPVIVRVPPFSIYYVYDRKQTAGGEGVQVGPSSRADVSGWIAAEQLVPWKQMLVGFFTQQGNRYPALFFHDRDTLVDLLESELGASHAGRMREETARSGADSPVVALEPDTYIDLQENFYLLPILNHCQADDDFATKLLNVAVVNANLQEQGAKATTGEEADPLAGFKVAITFVIDTTLSMGPYIEQTRDAIRRICDKTQTTHNFAVIAFRDSLKAKPELEYT